MGFDKLYHALQIWQLVCCNIQTPPWDYQAYYECISQYGYHSEQVAENEKPHRQLSKSICLKNVYIA